MKKLFTLVCATSLMVSAFGQIEIYLPGGDEDISGTLVEKSSAGADPHQDFDVRNATGATIPEVAIQRVRIEELEGTRDFLCWGADPETGACYSASYVSASDPFNTPDRSNLAPGADGWLSVHHEGNGVAGCATYRYYVMDADDNPMDSIDVRFCGTLSIEEQENLEVSIFPNPANSQVNVTVALNNNSNYTFKLFSVLGNEVLNKTLVDGNNTMDVKALPNGVYFYSILKANDVIETKKLVIRH